MCFCSCGYGYVRAYTANVGVAHLPSATTSEIQLGQVKREGCKGDLRYSSLVRKLSLALMLTRLVFPSVDCSRPLQDYPFVLHSCNSLTPTSACPRILPQLTSLHPQSPISPISPRLKGTRVYMSIYLVQAQLRAAVWQNAVWHES